MPSPKTEINKQRREINPRAISNPEAPNPSLKCATKSFRKRKWKEGRERKKKEKKRSLRQFVFHTDRKRK